MEYPKDLQWAKATYDVIFKDGSKKSYVNQACFAVLRDLKNGSLETIIIYSINCEITLEYKEQYLQYIIDMLDLQDASFNESSFTFKAFNCNKINLLVASLVRFLVENIGNVNINTIREPQLNFLKKVITVPRKYKDKLKNFCYLYKQLGTYNYFREVHSWVPQTTILKTTKDFKKIESLVTVNEFFNTE